MTELLIHHASHARIADRLRECAPAVSVVCWHPDGSLTRNGESVRADAIAPSVGWIGSDVLGGRHIRAYAGLLAELDSVRWVQSANAGLDHPVYPELARRGVRLTKSGAQSIPIAEYVLAHVLGHFQALPARRAAQGRREWKPHRFREVWHSTWLIIGYGHIGQGVARRARGFDAEIIVLRRSVAPDEHADVVAPLSSLSEHLPRADVVVLACPATDETRGLADADFFARMKEGSVLVNIARGSLVDETALVEGLDRGRPEHAVLDVFETEPLPEDNPLWAHPGVTVTAHTSNAGSGTRGRGDELFLDNLARYLAGEPLLDEVDPGALIAG